MKALDAGIQGVLSVPSPIFFGTSSLWRDPTSLCRMKEPLTMAKGVAIQNGRIDPVARLQSLQWSVAIIGKRSATSGLLA
jgi:hypothetical protein